jgi:hypothetical protein
MSEGSCKAREIDLGNGLGDVAVKINGATIEVHADGSIDAFTPGALKVHPAADDESTPASATSSNPKPGDRMPDGTIYAGVSPDTGKAMYAMYGSAPLTYTFNQAQKYAAKLDAHGHQDWRVPTKGELNVLYNNRAAIGGFDVSGSYPGGWYWSSSLNKNNNSAWAQRFGDGNQFSGNGNYGSSLRCVR